MQTFALSFDGYEHHGSYARCADIANRWEAAYKKNRSRPRSLDDLRTCLFFEQRRWRHFDAFPDTEAMRYIRSLLTEIRRLVRSSQLAPRQSGSQRNQNRPARSTKSSDTSPQHRRTSHSGSRACKGISVYFHDTEESRKHRWPLDHLLVMIQRNRPAQADGPHRTFVMGGKREYIAISTSGPDHFNGQHPLWGEQSKFEGAMMFDNLPYEDVRHILEKFYAGRSSEGCFGSYYGHFEFYRPDKPRAG